MLFLFSQENIIHCYEYHLYEVTKFFLEFKKGQLTDTTGSIKSKNNSLPDRCCLQTGKLRVSRGTPNIDAGVFKSAKVLFYYIPAWPLDKGA